MRTNAWCLLACAACGGDAFTLAEAVAIDRDAGHAYDAGSEDARVDDASGEASFVDGGRVDVDAADASDGGIAKDASACTPLTWPVRCTNGPSTWTCQDPESFCAFAAPVTGSSSYECAPVPHQCLCVETYDCMCILEHITAPPYTGTPSCAPSADGGAILVRYTP